MDRAKAKIIATVMAVMLALILTGLILLKLYIPFGAVAGAFFFFGFVNAAKGLYGWLMETREEDELEPPIECEPVTLEDVMAEFGGAK